MKIKIFFILLLTHKISLSQTDTSKQFLNKDFNVSGYVLFDSISIIKKKTFVYKDLNSVKMFNDTFQFYSSDSKSIYKLTTNNINKISIRNGNYLLSAAGYSALGGFALGFVLGTFVKGKGSGHPNFSFNGGVETGLAVGAVLGVVTGLIGGIFGAMTPSYEEINLSKYNKDTKTEKIKSVFRKYRTPSK